ncbi:MAG: hypothetical protein AB7F83_11920 [Lysobacterales bacterium]
MTAKRKDTSVTAAELMAELQRDPEYRGRMEKQEQEHQSRVTEWRRAEQPLIDELRAAGFDVESVWDLFNRKEPWNKKELIRPYLEALPILFKHLQLPYPDRVREGIARALAVPEARSGWGILKAVFEADPSHSGAGSKFAVGLALATAADDSVLEELIRLACDSRHGESRVALLLALCKSQQPIARAALLELREDPQLTQAVDQLLGRAAI